MTSAGTSRIPALDGLRGCAILLVVVGHTTPLLAGWVGVELFFVLSGYLITTILLDTRDRPEYFRRFYRRRALRIWPLYLLSLVVLLWFLPFTGVYTPEQRNWLATNGWWYWLHLANIGHAYAGNPPGHLTTHLWSLAVEEQYYLLWPLVIWLLPVPHARRVCVLLVALAIGARCVWMAGVLPPWANTIIRLDGIAVGSWLALAAPDQRMSLRRVGGAAVVALLAALALSPTLWPKTDPRYFAWLSTVVALVFGALVLYALTRSPRWLSWGWLRAFGRYSYCLYLVHVPIAVLLRPRVALDQLSFALAVTALSFAIGYVSWHLWEAPWLSLKDGRPIFAAEKAQAHGK